MKCQLHAAAALAALMLAGCQTLSNTIERRVEIAEQCKELIEMDQSAPIELSAIELRLGQIGSCPIGGQSEFVPLCALNQVGSRWIDDPAKSQLTGIGTAFTKAKNELIASLNALRDGVHARWTECQQNANDVLLRNSCLRKSILTTTNAAATVRRNAIRLRESTITVASELPVDAKMEFLLWDANFTAMLSKLEQAISGASDIIAMDGVRSSALRYSARRSLDSLHRALRPVDQAINRMDDKAYGLITAGNLFFGDTVRQSVSTGFDSIVQKYQDKAHKATKTNHPDNGKLVDPALKPFFVEMGLAACESLDKRNEYSMMGELVDTILIGKINDWIKQRWKDDPAHASTPLGALLAARKDMVPAISPEVAETYAIHEWAARSVLLKQQLLSVQAGNPGTALSKLALAVPEADVERLAESAVAAVIDPTLTFNEKLQPIFEPQRVTPEAAAHTVTEVAPSISPLPPPTGTQNAVPAPVGSGSAVLVEEPRGTSLCTSTKLQATTECSGDNVQGYSLRIRAYFPSGKCQSPDVDHEAREIALRLREYALSVGIRFSAEVAGYSSRRSAGIKRCAARGFKCIYRNGEGTSVSIQGCTGTIDGNTRISAERATRVAAILEEHGRTELIVQNLAAKGGADARIINGNDNLDTDRIVVIHVTPVTAAGRL